MKCSSSSRKLLLLYRWARTNEQTHGGRAVNSIKKISEFVYPGPSRCAAEREDHPVQAGLSLRAFTVSLWLCCGGLVIFLLFPFFTGKKVQLVTFAGCFQNFKNHHAPLQFPLSFFLAVLRNKEQRSKAAFKKKRRNILRCCSGLSRRAQTAPTTTCHHHHSRTINGVW